MGRFEKKRPAHNKYILVSSITDQYSKMHSFLYQKSRMLQHNISDLIMLKCLIGVLC